MADISSGSELLKLIREMWGNKVARVFGGIAITIGLIWAVMTVTKQSVETMDWLATRFTGISFQWGVFGNAMIVSIISLIALCVFAIPLALFFAILIRIGLDEPIQRSTDKVIDGMAQVVGNIETIMPAKIKTEVQEIRSQLNRLILIRQKSIVPKIVRFVNRKQR